jgi:hypothetical protein
MNFWGFPPPLLNSFKAYWEAFIQVSAGEAKSECLIPGAVDLFIKNNVTRVKVLDADSEWFGVTYKEDREAAVKRIAALTEAGVYPASLWA